MRVSVSSIRLGFAISAAVFFLDQWTKRFFFEEHTLSPIDEDSYFQVTRHVNNGLLANIPFPKTVLLAVTVLVTIAILYIWWRDRATQNTARMIGFALLVGGAFGNIFDRASLGFVRDWLLIFHRSIINLADIAIAAGFLLLIYQKWRTSSDTSIPPSSDV